MKADKCNDRIFVRGLEVTCIIGTRPAERKHRQKLILNIELECDLKPAGRSDSLDDTLNYSHLCRRIAAMAAHSSFFLLEKMASEVAHICLAEGNVFAVTVTIDKPAALKEARSAAVSIRRRRHGFAP